MKAWKSNSAGDRKGIFKVNQNQKTKAQAQAQEYRQAQTTDMKLKRQKHKDGHRHNLQKLMHGHTDRHKQLCTHREIQTLMYRNRDRHKQLCITQTYGHVSIDTQIDISNYA